MSAITQLREAWEGYCQRAGTFDGHTPLCDMRRKTSQYPCTCGFTAVEQAIKRVITSDSPLPERPYSVALHEARTTNLYEKI